MKGGTVLGFCISSGIGLGWQAFERHYSRTSWARISTASRLSPPMRDRLPRRSRFPHLICGNPPWPIAPPKNPHLACFEPDAKVPLTEAAMLSGLRSTKLQFARFRIVYPSNTSNPFGTPDGFPELFSALHYNPAPHPRKNDE